MDALGRDTYEQRFTGTTPYTLYAIGSYTYDYLGDILSIAQPGGLTTSFTYNMLKRKNGQTDADLGQWGYSYDANGNLTAQSDPRGAAGDIYTSYDGLNRQTARSTHSDLSSPYITYTYDSTANGNHGLGQLTGETFVSGPTGNVTGSYSYTYDNRGRKPSWSLTVNGTAYPVSSTFNDADQTLTTTYPDGDLVTTSYNGQDWLAGASETLSGTTVTLANSMAYTGQAGANGQPTSISEGNGTYTLALGYDLNSRLNSISATRVSDSTNLYTQTRSFDAAGNTLTTATTLPAGTDNQAFCYDDLNRLTWAGANGTPPCQSLTAGSLTSAAYQASFGYDTNWRLTSGPAGSTYTYGDTSHPHGVTSTSGGYTAAYDAVGDMTCRAPTSAVTCAGGSPTGQPLQYDAERHLVQWQSQPSGAQQYTQNAYDGDGDRVWEQVTNGSTTTTTVYLGQLEEISTTGGTTTTTKYYYAGERRLAVRVGSTLSYLVADGLSSVTEALDSSGNLAASQLYAPYGAVRYQSGTMPTSFGFTGLRLDASGLIVARSRFYDPLAGQYTEGDDALPGGGAILGGLNRYAYVVGNPETVTDETGHWPWDNIVAAVTNVVQAVAPAVANFVQAAAPVVASVANAALGISDMVNDVKTLFNPNASWQDKFGSIVNFGFNAFMDVTTVIGVGEGLKGLQVAGKLAADEGEHLVEDGAEKAVEEGGSVAEDTAKDTGDVCPPNSFRGDTPVATPHGAKLIGTLKVGDTVLAYDGATGKVKAESVQHVFINHDTNLLDVTLSTATTTSLQGQAHSATKQREAEVAAHGTHAPPATETLHTTTEHPFLTAELGWVNAQDLKSGEHVRRMDGSLGVVVGIKVVAGAAVRYNLTVAQDHTYLVGEGEWVVHNCKWGSDNPELDTNEIDKHSSDEYDRLKEQSNGSGPRAQEALNRLRNPGKSWFPFSGDELYDTVRSAWAGRLKAGARLVQADGDVVRVWRGVASTRLGDILVEGVYNETRNLIRTAYPIFR